MQSRRLHPRLREKPKYHKCAPLAPNDECPVNSPNFLPDNHLRTAASAPLGAIDRQSLVTEIPFLRAKIPLSAPPIARTPPNDRAPTQSLAPQKQPRDTHHLNAEWRIKNSEWRIANGRRTVAHHLPPQFAIRHSLFNPCGSHASTCPTEFGTSPRRRSWGLSRRTDQVNH